MMNGAQRELKPVRRMGRHAEIKPQQDPSSWEGLGVQWQLVLAACQALSRQRP